MREEKSLLETIFKAQYESLCKTSYRILGDKNVAEDIVQDVFCRILESNKIIDLKELILPYLHRSVINNSLNYLRSAKNRAHREMLYGETVYEPKNFTDEILQLKTLKIKVDQTINQLPPVCKTVFILSRFENLKYREIAKQLNISVKTVEIHMVKALKHIRKHLGFLLCIYLIIYFF